MQTPDVFFLIHGEKFPFLYISPISVKANSRETRATVSFNTVKIKLKRGDWRQNASMFQMHLLNKTSIFPEGDMTVGNWSRCGLNFW